MLDDSLSFSSLLKMNEDDKTLTFLGKRVLLFDSYALGLLKKELIDNVGFVAARSILTRIGFAHGWQMASSLAEYHPEYFRDENSGPAIHSLHGFTKIRDFTYSYKPFYEGRGKWENSYEAEQHLLQIGHSEIPVCWMMAGCTSGYCTRLYGRETYAIEEKCVGKGDSHCEIVMRHKEDWGDLIHEHLPFYHIETLDDALKNVNKKLKKNEKKLWEINRLLDGGVLPSGIVAKSTSTQILLDTASRAAKSDFPVLIYGESGTGKEVIARYIHNESPRESGPFIAVNCNAIPDSLIDSELFGYTKGAFTGAVRDRAGLFESANGGTLFLDEIGDIQLPMQGKLLRVLQEKQIRRIGSNNAVNIDVRIVAAMNKNLRKAVEKGEFREDLYYRINVINLECKPLRERKDDIIPLVYLFMNLASETLGKKDKDLSHKAAEALQKYDWPGNIRELRNAVERAMALCMGSSILIEDLPEYIRDGYYNKDLKSVEDAEKELIIKTLRITEGNKKEAAKRLGIGIASLYRKIKKWNIKQ